MHNSSMNTVKQKLDNARWAVFNAYRSTNFTVVEWVVIISIAIIAAAKIFGY